MSTLNIGGDSADVSYRYKMPKMVTKIEGRGNGIKTVIVNMVDIAKSLHCDPAYPTKYFGIELGAQSMFNAKTERAIVNGAHNAPDLAKLLDKFIQSFILCPTCKLPEIKMDVKKGNIKIDCAACGHNGHLQSGHRLVTFIVKHKEESNTKSKDPAAKKARKKDKKKKGEDDEAEAEGDEDEDEGDANEAAPKKKDVDSKKKKKEKEEEVEWFTDTSKEAQAKRKEAEFAELKNVGENGKKVDAILSMADTKDKLDSPATTLKLFMASGNRTPEEVVAEVRRLQLARGFDDPQKVKVLLEALIDFSEPKNVPAQYAKHAQLLKQFVKETTANILINCIEEQVGVVQPKLLKYTPVILKSLYEQEVLTEEGILAWAEAPPEASWLVNKEVAQSVRKKAAPFVDWLKNAEEDSEEED